MSAELPADIEAQLQRFQVGIEKIESLVQKWQQKPILEHGQELGTTQRAQLHLAAAQCVHIAFLMLLRTQGLASKQHPVHQEGERLKFYAKKVRKLESEEYLSTHKPSLEVNVAAANRFISAALPDLNRDQRQALNQAGQRAAPQAQGATSQPRVAATRAPGSGGPPDQKSMVREPGSLAGGTLQQQQAGQKRKATEPVASLDAAKMARTFLAQTLGMPPAKK